MNQNCNCSLCQARRLKKHPLQIYFGIDSIESKLIEINSTLPIYVYERYTKDSNGKPKKNIDIESTISEFKKEHNERT